MDLLLALANPPQIAYSRAAAAHIIRDAQKLESEKTVLQSQITLVNVSPASRSDRGMPVPRSSAAMAALEHMLDRVQVHDDSQTGTNGPQPAHTLRAYLHGRGVEPSQIVDIAVHGSVNGPAVTIAYRSQPA